MPILDFFHKIVNEKRRRNFLKELEVEGGRVVRANDEKAKEVTSFFKGLYKEEVLEGLD